MIITAKNVPKPDEKGIIRISEKCTEIKDWAFEGVSAKEIIIPGKTIIGNMAFSDSYIDKITISKDYELRASYLESSNFKEVVLKRGTKQLPSRFLFNNKTIEKISLPDSITSISDNAFAFCENLRDVHLPKSLKYLGPTSFAYTNIIEIDIPQKVKKISETTFLSCKYLDKVSLPDTLEKIENSAFGDCTSLKNITLPNKLKSLGKSVFAATNINFLVLPDSLEKITKNSFDDLPEAVVIYESKVLQQKHLLDWLGAHYKTDIIPLDYLLEKGQSLKDINETFSNVEEQR